MSIPQRKISNRTSTDPSLYNSDNCYTFDNDYDDDATVQSYDGQKVYYDENSSKASMEILKIGTSIISQKDKYVSKVPRHGENVASCVYNPPHLILNRQDADPVFKNAGLDDKIAMSYVSSTTPFNFARYKSIENLRMFGNKIDKRLLSCADNYLGDRSFFNVPSSNPLNVVQSTRDAADFQNKNLYYPKDILYTFAFDDLNSNKILAIEFTHSTHITRFAVSSVNFKLMASAEQIVAINYTILSDGISTYDPFKIFSTDPAITTFAPGTNITASISGIGLFDSLDSSTSDFNVALKDPNGNLKTFNLSGTSIASVVNGTSPIELKITAPSAGSPYFEGVNIGVFANGEFIPGYWDVDGAVNVMSPDFVLGSKDSNGPLRYDTTTFDPYYSNGTDFNGNTFDTDGTQNKIGYLDLGTGTFTEINITYSNGPDYDVSVPDPLSTTITIDPIVKIPGIFQTGNGVFIPGAYGLSPLNFCAGIFEVSATDNSKHTFKTLKTGFKSYVKNLMNPGFTAVEIETDPDPSKRGRITFANFQLAYPNLADPASHIAYAASGLTFPLLNFYKGIHNQQLAAFIPDDQNITEIQGIQIVTPSPDPGGFSFGNTNQEHKHMWTDLIIPGIPPVITRATYIDPVNDHFYFDAFYTTSDLNSTPVLNKIFSDISFSGGTSAGNCGAYLITSDQTITISLDPSKPVTDVILFTSAKLTLNIGTSCRATVVIMYGGSLEFSSVSTNYVTVYNLSVGTVTNIPQISPIQVNYITNTFKIIDENQATFKVKMSSFLNGATTAFNDLNPNMIVGVPPNGIIFRTNSKIEKFYPDETTNAQSLVTATVANYSVATSVDETIREIHCQALCKQIQYQYKVEYNETTPVLLDRIFSGNEAQTRVLVFHRGDREIKVYAAFIVNNFASNIGFCTQSAGFDYYKLNNLPLTMVKTRKNGNFYLLSKAGSYHKFQLDGEIKINGSFGPNGLSSYSGTLPDLDIFDYPTAGTTELDLDGTGNVRITGSEIFSRVNNFDTNALFLGGIEKSCYRFAPLNGHVTAATNPQFISSSPDAEKTVSDLYCDFEIVDGVLYVRNRFPSKSRAITLDVTVRGNTDLSPYCNTAENFSVNQHKVSFANNDFAHVVVNSSSQDVQDIMIPVPVASVEPISSYGGTTSGNVVYTSDHNLSINSSFSTNPTIPPSDAMSRDIKVCVVFQGIEITDSRTTDFHNKLANNRSVFYTGSSSEFIPSDWMAGFPITSDVKYLDPHYYEALPQTVQNLFDSQNDYKRIEPLPETSTTNQSITVTGVKSTQFYINTDNNAVEVSMGSVIPGVIKVLKPALGGKYVMYPNDFPSPIYFIEDVEYRNRSEPPVTPPLPVAIEQPDILEITINLYAQALGLSNITRDYLLEEAREAVIRNQGYFTVIGDPTSNIVDFINFELAKLGWGLRGILLPRPTLTFTPA